MSAAAVMGIRGLPVFASWAAGRVGVPVCEAGRRPERDFSRSAVDCVPDTGTAEGVGAGGVGCAEGGLGNKPLLDSEASKSPPFTAGVEAA